MQKDQTNNERYKCSSLQWFSPVPYPRMAMYGKRYVLTCKDTSQLLNSTGFDLLFTYDVSEIIMYAISVSGGILSLIVSNLMNLHLVVGYFYGYYIVKLLFTMIRSVIVTTWIVWAEDRTLLLQNHEEEYKKLCEAAKETYGTQMQW